ncbi:MAG TPA: type II toxin-antitoxin system VapB family antitoxin [Tepidisphaeraceae bacterium]|nr:type II toxin-antitoxin system VapB family antitoxin [Tepidisphaeraceae bacterium]
MKTTVDIPDDVLKEAMALTQASSKRDAIVGAMREFIRRERAKEAVKLLGTFKTVISSEELEERRSARSTRQKEQWSRGAR